MVKKFFNPTKKQFKSSSARLGKWLSKFSNVSSELKSQLRALFFTGENDEAILRRWQDACSHYCKNDWLGLKNRKFKWRFCGHRITNLKQLKFTSGWNLFNQCLWDLKKCIWWRKFSRVFLSHKIDSGLRSTDTFN